VAVAVNERLHADLAAGDLHDEPAALGATDTRFFRIGDGEITTTAGSLVGSLTTDLVAWLDRRRVALAQLPASWAIGSAVSAEARTTGGHCCRIGSSRGCGRRRG
jgi:hypothetical protein